MSKARAENSGENSGRSEFSIPFASFCPGAIPAGIPPWMTALSHLNGKGQVACREWASFLSRRFQEDIKLVNRLTSCAAPQDAFIAYSDFFQRASADYHQEWAELMKIGQSSACELTSCAQQVVEAASHHEPSKAA